MTLAEYEVKLAQQNGACAACHQPETGINQYGSLPLAIDHNHKTGQRRGLLCRKCNQALGLLRDDPKIITQLSEYVQHYDNQAT